MNKSSMALLNHVTISIVSLLSYYKIYSIRASCKWMIILDVMNDNNVLLLVEEKIKR